MENSTASPQAEGAAQDPGEEMGTQGPLVGNAHLRHVPSRAISRCTESETQKSRRRREGESEKRRIEGKIDKAREGWNTHDPSGTVLYFKPDCERIEGIGGQSITVLAHSYKAGSLCGPPQCLPSVHTHVAEDREGAPHFATGGSSSLPICKPIPLLLPPQPSYLREGSHRRRSGH